MDLDYLGDFVHIDGQTALTPNTVDALAISIDFGAQQMAWQFLEGTRVESFRGSRSRSRVEVCLACSHELL